MPEQTFYRRKEFGAIGVAQVRGLKQLEDENAKLKHLVADLSLDNEILQDALRKESVVQPAPSAGRVRTRCLPGDGEQSVPRAMRVVGDDAFRVRPARAGEAAHADQGDCISAFELGLAADLRAAVSRWLARQPQAIRPSASPERTEYKAKSPKLKEIGGDSRPIGRADAPGRAL